MSKENKNEDKNKKEKKGDDDLGEVSYTYWKRDSDLKADHVGFQPQTTSGPVNIHENNNNVGSAWNKAGTWEEKNLTKNQFETFFNDYIKNNKKEYKGVFTFDEISGYSGEVSIIFYFVDLFCLFKRKNKIFL